MSLFQFQKSPQINESTSFKRPKSSSERLRTFLLVLNAVVTFALLGFILFWLFIKPPHFIISGTCPEPLEKNGYACEPCSPEHYYNQVTKSCQTLHGINSCSQTYDKTNTAWAQETQAFTFNKSNLTSKVCKPVSSTRKLYKRTPDTYEFVSACEDNSTYIKGKVKIDDTHKSVRICTGTAYCNNQKNDDLDKIYGFRYGNECSDSCDAFGDKWVYVVNTHDEKICQSKCPDGYLPNKQQPQECIKASDAKSFYIIDQIKYASRESSCDQAHPYSYQKDHEMYCTPQCGADTGFPYLDQATKTCISTCKLGVKQVNGQKVCAPAAKIISAPESPAKANPAENVNSMINALIRPEKKALERYQQTLRSDNLNPDQAHLLIKQTISQWPEEDASYTAAADYWIRNNDPKQALRLLTWRPYPIADHVDYYSTLAYTFLINNNEKNAQQIYDSLVRIEPKNPKWWLGLGTSYDHMGKTPQAYKSWRKAYFYADKNAEYVSFLESKLQSEESEA